jgi:alpha-L-rhamnosidase
MSRCPMGVVLGLLSVVSMSCSRDSLNPPPPGQDVTAARSFAHAFDAPSPAARPSVYWYFMDGHITRQGLTADLEAMKAAGIGGAIFLTVDIGVPRGPVVFNSPEWKALFQYAIAEADRLGIEITLGVGPGWSGSGGPWVKADDAMQHLVGTTTKVQGGKAVDVILPKPAPREPYFGRGSFTPDLLKTWQDIYVDVAVLAYPTPAANAPVSLIDEKALYYRAPYSSSPNVRPFIDVEDAGQQSVAGLDRRQMVDVTRHMTPDGRLMWDAPPGDWTVYRFGRTLTGQTSRPAPLAGLGFETDKLSRAANEAHIRSFLDPLVTLAGKPSGPGRGLTRLHLDSWEMGAQNWSPSFRDAFKARRGYDPLPWFPAYLGQIVGTALETERFLWDLRQTARELLFDEYAVTLRDYAHEKGLAFSAQFYDMNPSGDLKLGSIADFPMGEFWAWNYGFSTEFSVVQAVSVAHTNGKTVVGGEAFTADAPERWQLYPANMKAQTDWALAAGLNAFAIHRYQHQPTLDDAPGMRMGDYGVHWERTQTFWPMVDGYHRYLQRCADVLRVGIPVADVLYLVPEGSPHVFRPPSSATRDARMDRLGYNFDGCDPDTLIARADVVDGDIHFPDGMRYRILVLPKWDTMSPALLAKIEELVRAGATIIGSPPARSPGLSGQPESDRFIAEHVRALWGETPQPRRRVGKGNVIVVPGPPSSPDEADPLHGAKWIWHNDGRADLDMPPETRHLIRKFTIADLDAVLAASMWVGVDNSWEVFVNEKRVGVGADHRRSPRIDIAAALVQGENHVRIAATNGGTSPNPAGAVAVLTIDLKDATRQTIVTDATWAGSETAEGPTKPVRVLDPIANGWRGSRPPEVYRELYPDYTQTARVLASMGTPPDFESADFLRYTHRRTDDADLYFIANPTEQPIDTVATFRVHGRAAAWWNPLTGERRALDTKATADGRQRIYLALHALESGFVVFSNDVQPSTAKATTLQTLDIAGPWTVAFDPRWGGPEMLVMNTLTDWSIHADPGVRFYSGRATYRTRFDAAPSTKDSAGQVLRLGDVKVMARVILNGQDLGVCWCEPWSVPVPTRLLREKDNTLEIEVANQWPNRLIGDAALRVHQRFTKTSRNPFRVDDALLSSGLLGPVRLEWNATAVRP